MNHTYVYMIDWNMAGLVRFKMIKVAVVVLLVLKIVVAIDIFEQPQVTTLEGLSFNDWILSLTIHYDGSLLVTESSLLWQVDLNQTPPQKTLIAGSRSQDYQDGDGANARFNQPGGVLSIDSAIVLVADSYNHCIRQVDLLTKAVSCFAGQCQVEGFLDGHRLNQSKFDLPGSLVKMNEQILISDRYNGAIRIIENDYVTTLAKGTPIDKPSIIAPYSTELIYVIVEGGIVSINLTDRENPRLALKLPKKQQYDGLLRITNEDFLISEASSSNIKLVDIRHGVIKSDIYQTGCNISECRLNQPSCMVLYNGTILIGQKSERNRLKNLTLPILRDTSPIRCPRDMQITIQGEATDEYVNITWDSPVPDYELGLECIECPNTTQKIKVSGMPVKNRYQYKYMDHKWNQEIGCSFNVTVTQTGQKHNNALIGVSVSCIILLIILIIVIISFIVKLKAVNRDKDLYRQIPSSNGSNVTHSTTLPRTHSLHSQIELLGMGDNETIYPYETISGISYADRRRVYTRPQSFRHRQLPQPNIAASPDASTVYEGPWTGTSSTTSPHYSDMNNAQQRLAYIYHLAGAMLERPSSLEDNGAVRQTRNLKLAVKPQQQVNTMIPSSTL